ncbi:HPF/RaiA family ribosome-associated protein [Seonamhaeicola sp. ML3]|uniref:HPF/RaiA family ribosome-associated protein n=1 Tax=Seonamhaeicola sp. ML3 TaxID=2937786 RepID=UPI00200CE828|nr:HPF/RaiA family ribosome-associated protein [Seonamhaeicola sp. ML3]
METIFNNSKAKRKSYLRRYAHYKLRRLLRHYPCDFKASVTFSKEKKNKNICGINLSLPGTNIYAAHSETNIRKAINNVIKDLEIMLEHRKTTLLHKCI